MNTAYDFNFALPVFDKISWFLRLKSEISDLKFLGLTGLLMFDKT
jgi:hypothetical protein